MTNKEAYECGKQAFLDGKKRAPMSDHKLKKMLQSKVSAKKHPSSPGSDLSESQRRAMENKLIEWKRGWDEERAKI